MFKQQVSVPWSARGRCGGSSWPGPRRALASIRSSRVLMARVPGCRLAAVFGSGRAPRWKRGPVCGVAALLGPVPEDGARPAPPGRLHSPHRRGLRAVLSIVQ